MSSFTELKTSATSELPPPAAASDPAMSAGATATVAAAATAISRVASVIPSAESLKDRVIDVWSRSRPWSEFLNTAQMNRPEISEVLERVKENAEYYAFNYLVILLVMSAFTVITSPLAFLGGIFIVGAYFYLYFLNPDPIVVAGITVDKNAKAAIIMIFSLAVLWLTGAGATFTGLVLAVGVIALSHAAIRKPPGEADFETAYTPATV